MLRELAAAAFPAACPGCGARAEPVCPACATGLRPPVPAPPPPGIDTWVAAFAYEGVARELIARVKYRDARATVHWLAERVAETLSASGVPPVDVVTWAPTSPERRRARGYDHAELLARAVARRLGLRATRLLVRLPGPAQTGRALAARRLGPRFSPRGGGLAGRRVLVVDDVATTGATLAAAAAALRASGAAVVAACAARTPPGSARGRRARTPPAGGPRPPPPGHEE